MASHDPQDAESISSKDESNNVPQDYNDRRPLQFVLDKWAPITTSTTRDSSRAVRSQAMRDYLWRMHHPSEDCTKETGAGHKPEEQTNLMSRFRVKDKTKPVSSRKQHRESSTELVPSKGASSSSASDEGLSSIFRLSRLGIILQQQILLGQQALLDKGLDPFDPVLRSLGPSSEKLVAYYHQGYTMNLLALNFQEDCIAEAAVDLGLLHSILYILATDYELRHEAFDSTLSARHYGEAIRLISKQLNQEIVTDTAIAAVALIATSENLKGRLELSNVHMNGLQHMIAKRGGIQKVPGISGRVTTWADFCDANLRNRQPRFCRPVTAARRDLWGLRGPAGRKLSQQLLFMNDSSLVPVIHSLRDVSRRFDPEAPRSSEKSEFSLIVYDIEYDLSNLNAEGSAGGAGLFLSQEANAVKTALHIYLYLFVRLLPAGSHVLNYLCGRLRTFLEPQSELWWAEDTEKQQWFLWMLVVGSCAAPSKHEGFWFEEKASFWCTLHGVGSEEDLQSALAEVVWNGRRCRAATSTFWNKMVNEYIAVVEMT